MCFDNNIQGIVKGRETHRPNGGTTPNHVIARSEFEVHWDL